MLDSIVYSRLEYMYWVVSPVASRVYNGFRSLNWLGSFCSWNLKFHFGWFYGRFCMKTCFPIHFGKQNCLLTWVKYYLQLSIATNRLIKNELQHISLKSFHRQSSFIQKIKANAAGLFSAKTHEFLSAALPEHESSRRKICKTAFCFRKKVKVSVHKGGR